MLVGWKCRGTFPCLWSSNASETLDRTDVREKDATSKLESKKYADAKRGAKYSDIAVGDRVLITQPKKHKSDPTFSADRFTVIAREGAKVVVRSDRGVQYARNIQDVKQVPAELEAESEEMIIEQNDEDHVRTPSQAQQIQDNNEHNETATTRPHRIIKKPNRFKDMILFTIFE
ncbi:uncharacterized protein LOC134204914 [Armigeres subalbatus]|uniref:uncharacterized protein LOC134204914 n=1 Tax=Armigeres subalbatus TaxID=124917 RepID=UPI002ED03E9F